MKHEDRPAIAGEIQLVFIFFVVGCNALLRPFSKHRFLHFGFFGPWGYWEEGYGFLLKLDGVMVKQFYVVASYTGSIVFFCVHEFKPGYCIGYYV